EGASEYFELILAGHSDAHPELTLSNLIRSAGQIRERIGDTASDAADREHAQQHAHADRQREPGQHLPARALGLGAHVGQRSRERLGAEAVADRAQHLARVQHRVIHLEHLRALQTNAALAWLSGRPALFWK